MLKKRLSILLLSCFGASLVSIPAWAVGFRAETLVATIGQPLDVSVGLSVSPDETLDPDCARAQVTIGDVLQPREGVGVQLLGAAEARPTVRIRTLSPVLEPVVSVEVVVGCLSVVSRKFVVFADPPGLVATPSVNRVTESLPQVAAGSPALRAAQEASVSSPRLRLTSEGRTLASSESAVNLPQASGSKTSRRTTPPRQVGTGVAAGPATVAPEAPVKRARKSPAPKRAPPVSRLKLDSAPIPGDAPSSSVTDDALAAVREANAAVLAAIAAASASQSRMAALEAQVERLRLESQEQAAITAQLRERAALAERRTAWVVPLLGAVLLLAGLAVWLWMRLRALDAVRRAPWQQAVAAQQHDEVPGAKAPAASGSVPMLVERSIHSGVPASLRGGFAPAAVVSPSELFDDPVVPHFDSELDEVMRTQPLPPSSTTPKSTSRGVSAEELIDLEQQAEFFIVLGQEDSAIELLVRHLRETGGKSPLPYLKLLDIYRDLGDRPAYDRTRERFNQRFNALAPEFEASPEQGRDLSAYPEVLKALQAGWTRPVDSMADLEALLFRRDGGELFDLNAYRDLLFLYALARDLTQSENEGAGVREPVDVLLPLHGAASSRVPGSDEPSWGDVDVDVNAERVTSPVDLDLSEPSESSYDRLT